MRKTVRLTAFVVISTVAQFAFAQETAPFSIGEPTVQGNGCPEGTYSVVLSPDGTELTILYNSFTAETDESNMYDFANCNIAIPVAVPSGITVGLIGVDYRGLAYIPDGGIGMFSREHFFAGARGEHNVSLIEEYDQPYEFYYPDDLSFISWTKCGDNVLARSNATVFVSRTIDGTTDAMMSVFSEDWETSILFRLTWRYC